MAAISASVGWDFLKEQEKNPQRYVEESESIFHEFCRLYPPQNHHWLSLVITLGDMVAKDGIAPVERSDIQQ